MVSYELQMFANTTNDEDTFSLPENKSFVREGVEIIERNLRNDKTWIESAEKFIEAMKKYDAEGNKKFIDSLQKSITKSQNSISVTK